MKTAISVIVALILVAMVGIATATWLEKRRDAREANLPPVLVDSHAERPK